MFAKGEFDKKIKGVFGAFDQDGNQYIDKKELVVFLNTGIFGLCKLVKVPLPRRDDINNYSYVVFKIIDLNKNDQIEYDEFAKWIKESDEIQDFLLKYTGQQTFDRARKRYQLLLDFYKTVFDKISIDFMGEQYALTAQLRIELFDAMKDIQPEIIARLFTILDYENKGAVSEFEYFTVMKPWASFSATDINNDNQLDTGELKTLIWLIDEEEPSEIRVQRDLALMDRDGSGTIDRLEWILYLASPDPTTGAEVFDFKLKRAFDTHDANHNGAIDLEELNKLLQDNFEEFLKGRNQENRQIILELIKSLSKDIMNALDTTHEGQLDWSQFKHYNSVAAVKEKQVKEYMLKLK